MKTVHKVLLSLSAIAMLGGCATRLATHEIPYDTNQSRAGNIAGIMHIGHIPDTEVATGFDENGSLVWDSVSNVGKLNVPKVGMGGLRGWDSIGVGVGFALLNSLVQPKDTAATNQAFGYVPLSLAKTPEEARDVFVHSVAEAFNKAAKEMKLDKHFEIVRVTEVIRGIRYENTYFINEELGCVSNTSKKRGRYNQCFINVRKYAPSEKPVPTATFVKSTMTAWDLEVRKGYESLVVRNGHNGVIDMEKLFALTAKYLPKYAYVYRATEDNNKGNKKNLPFILERDRINFFIKTASNKTK